MSPIDPKLLGGVLAPKTMLTQATTFPPTRPPPPSTGDPLFTRAADELKHVLDERGVALDAEYEKRLANKKIRHAFRPYLLIRSYTGDSGVRPIAAGRTPAWSPDIWLVEGDPATTPAIPATPLPSWPNDSYRPRIGVTHTVYAHIWNLGTAPVGGAKVEFYWFHAATNEVDRAHANGIGVAWVDLAPAGLAGCHRLVKCPVAWKPSAPVRMDVPTWLLVRISCIGDGISPTAWRPSDRHVAVYDYRTPA